MTKEFIPDAEFETTPEYPTVFGITLTPPVSGVLIALLGVAAAAYLGVNFVLPTWDEYQVLKEDVAKKEGEIAQQEETLKKVEQVKAELAAAQQRQEDVLALFANEQTLDTLLYDLNQLITRRNAGVLAATRNKLRNCPAWVRSQFTDLRRTQNFEERVGPLVSRADLQLFQPDPKASGIVNDGSLGTNLNNKLKRQIVNVRFEGNFSQTQSILRSIERLQPLLVISDFQSSLGSQQQSGSGQPGGLYQIENGRVRFLTNCQPETTITTTFKLQALLPLTPEERAAVAPQPSPSPSPTQ
jgi:type IV pilus assembly protein PilO